ncbi:MAG: hypothetical protein QOK08_1593 [Actinomycetota bacterium]|jgi:hypothetical protein|nr:hypothetical protein [Actinomycetota bacterium]
MGGGRTRDQESRKSVLLSPRRGDGKAGAGGVDDLSMPLCERERTVAFRVVDEHHLEAHTQISIVRADPPAIVVRDQVVGYLSDQRQAATLAACLDEGYQIAGEVQAVDEGGAEGLATVVGVRARL